MRLVRGNVDEIAFVGGCEELIELDQTAPPSVRTQIYDPRRNSWREAAQLLDNNWAHTTGSVCFSSGAKITLLGAARLVTGPTPGVPQG